MKAWQWMLVGCLTAIRVGTVSAQASSPVLGSIESPYAPLQGAVTMAGHEYGAGQVNYGPAGTPLVLTGANLGGGGTLIFWAYRNGTIDRSAGNNGAVQASPTLWTPSMIVVTVPSGALTGLVTVTVEGTQSNGLPFMVTPGSYAGGCPAGPSSTQLQITTASLHDGQVSQPYEAQLSSEGGTGQIAWSITSGTLPAGLTLNQPSSANNNRASISGTPTATTGTNPAPLTFQVTDSSNPRQTDQAMISLTIQPQAMTQGGIYSYTVGHDPVGNVTQIQDAGYNNGPGVMGNWQIAAPDGSGGSGYDALNRLTGASVTWPNGTQQYLCWQYDSYGNRLAQEISSSTFQSGSGGANACSAQASAMLGTSWASYNTNNQVASTNARGVTVQASSSFNLYDGAGNMTADGVNTYLYDGEGRVCAVQNTAIPGTTALTGYLYDADGTRVAKGSLTQFTCDLNPGDSAFNGFTITENYVLGLGSEQLTQLDGQGNWQRTNVYAAGKLIGTYDLVSNPNYNPSQPASASNPTQIPWLHFHLEDPLGTRRMQISGMLANLGQPEMDFQSLPFGDQLASSPDPYADQSTGQSSTGATPLFFTSKERDSESGNDYFGARYYANSMGRFLSPDWSAKVEPVPYATMSDPQSLNLYAYVRNNPMTSVNADGHMSNADFSEMFMQAASAYINAAWELNTGDTAEHAATAQDEADEANSESAELTASGMPDPAQKQSGSGWSSTKPTRGDYVTVSDWSKSAGGFHHVGLAVNSDDTHGFSTKDPHTPWWQRIFGAPKARMEDDLICTLARAERWHHIHTCITRSRLRRKARLRMQWRVERSMLVDTTYYSTTVHRQ